MREDELARRRRRSGRELRERLRAVRTGRGAGEREAERGVDLDPRSAYELLTRQMVGDLGEELREIRQRVNGLLFVTVGAVIADVVLRLAR